MYEIWKGSLSGGGGEVGGVISNLIIEVSSPMFVHTEEKDFQS